MPNLNVVIPTSLATTLNDAVARRASSLDSVVTAALSQYFEIDRHRAYQISTSAALVQGASDGAVSSQTLLAHGDFGLGTFEHLDGEMVVLDGDIYQVRGDGSVQRRQDNFRIPFAVVSRFQPDESFDVGPIEGLEALAQACDPHRESDNLFYALRADGFFCPHAYPRSESRRRRYGARGGCAGAAGIPLHRYRGHSGVPLVPALFEFL
jgi:acetolactate decarboxylase